MPVMRVLRQYFERLLDNDARIISNLHQINERLRHMATQADIDALSAQLTEAVGVITSEASELTNAVASIQDEIDTLVNQNPNLDVTALTNAVQAVVDSASVIKSAADDVEAIPSPAPAVPEEVPTAPPADTGTAAAAGTAGATTDQNAPTQVTVDPGETPPEANPSV